MDRAKFFAAARASVFGGSLAPSQVEGIESILDGCTAYGVNDNRQIAYVLATPMIETGGLFVPISENLNYGAAGLMGTFPTHFSASEAQAYQRQPQRIANHAYANRNGNGDEASGDGWLYRGRGYCQITGRANYARFAQLLGVDLIGHPDLAMSDDVAAKIIVIGMRDGLFTGKKLADYITPASTDYLHARQIINRMDRAQDIANFAVKIQAALRSAA